jgi:hypothetical protein
LLLFPRTNRVMLNRAVEKHPKIVARILKKRKSICTIGSRRARSCALRCSEQQISFHAHHLTSFDLETKKYGSDMKVSLKLSSSIYSTWKFTGEKCLDNIYHFLFAFLSSFWGDGGYKHRILYVISIVIFNTAFKYMG